MIRTFLVPIELDTDSPEELQLTAGDIGDAVTAAGLALGGDVHPWSPPTLVQPTPIAQTTLPPQQL